MVRSRLRLRKINYAINISRLIEDVYYSDPREIAREFVSLEKFTDTVLNHTEHIAAEVIRTMDMGYRYLLAESEGDFINVTLFDECCVDHHLSLSYIAGELLNNLVVHFCYELAFYLLDTTDIEEFLDNSLKLISVTKYSVTFTYED